MILDPGRLETPCYVCDRQKIRENLEILASVQERTGCKILLALKGFAMWSLFPQIRGTLRGASASSLDEMRLGYEELGGEIHVYAPAYKDAEIPVILDRCDHLVFNSFGQWRRFRPLVRQARRRVRCGIRINPEYSEVAVDKYNPSGRYSRLGVTRAQFREDELEGISGLHFHSLCEQNADVLVRTMARVEDNFGPFLAGMEWLNLGGGHHITRPDYDVETLCGLLVRLRETYNVEVYLEPGEAIALNAGVLVAQVLDIVENGMAIAILDTSATAHMPDVLDMPYRPEVVGAGRPGEHPHTYRLGGLTCLAGDVIGDYSFPRPLEVGSRLVFLDMAHYTMVKNTTFNGVRLPSIAIYDSATGGLETVRIFGYEDYRSRLS